MGTQLPLEKPLRIQIHELPPISSDVCIYRVPEELRSVNEKAYTPQIVSIGPMHHGKTELQAMEEHKLRCLQAFLDRTKKSLEDCIGVVKKLEERARNCYAERIGLNSDQFVNLLLMDSCLIIEIMLRNPFKVKEKPTDYLSKRILTFGLKMDMLLLENQIPFFVLDGVFNLGISNYPCTNNFLNLSLFYFEQMIIFEVNQTKIDDVMQYVAKGNEVKHFVDLLRICHLPSTLLLSSDNIAKISNATDPPEARIFHPPSTLRLSSYNTSKILPIRNATYLQEAGMNIKKGSSNGVHHIKYTTGVLEISHINVGDGSEHALRNILALETCHYPHDTYMFGFICFIDMLINTAKDVDMLIQNGILTNWLSDSSAAANLFNGLGIGVEGYEPMHYIYMIWEQMNAYCIVPRHKWRASFLRDYCSTPWMAASTSAAVILLLLTLTQIVCSIISFIV